MKMQRFLALFLGVSALVYTGGARGDDAKADKADQQEKKILSEKDVEVPDGTPEELNQIVQAAMQAFVGGRGEKSKEQVREKAFTILKASDKILAHPDATDDERTLARRNKLRVLYMSTQADEAIFAKRLSDYVAQLTKEQPGSAEAALGNAFLIVRNHFDRPVPTAEVVKKLEDFAKAYPTSEIGVQLFTMFGRSKEGQNKPKEALEVYKAGVKAYAKSPKLADQLQGPLAKLELIGKPMELAGPTLEGSEFNLKSLKGKVVLVDFWATWCGPCVGEIPGVKSVYHKYKDKGFEVVGVSLDNDKEDLEKFVKEREIPWTQILFEDEKDRGWKNPLARKYGINAIPAMFLVDRNGKVVSTSIRGEKAIEREVKRLLEAPAPPLAN